MTRPIELRPADAGSGRSKRGQGPISRSARSQA
jgi:hypothetical protein